MNKLIITFITLSSLFIFGCILEEENPTDTPNPIIAFLDNSNYKYSESKFDIPKIVIDSLSKIYDEKFKIGDTTNLESINLTCVRLDSNEYYKRLNFTFVNDTFCLLSYTQGGIGTFETLDFVKYKGEFKHIFYTPEQKLTDTFNLRNLIIKKFDTFNHNY